MAAIKCRNCEEMIPLSKGVGPVGAKTFQCPRCGHVTDMSSRGRSDDDTKGQGPSHGR
jgi:hypothetical protein